MLILSLLLCGLFCLYHPGGELTAKPGYSKAQAADGWDKLIASVTNREAIRLQADGAVWKSGGTDVYMGENRQLMVPVEAIRGLLRCSAGVYDGKTLKLLRNNKSVEAGLFADSALVDKKRCSFQAPFVKKDGVFYVSAELITAGLDYSMTWDYSDRLLQLTDNSPSAARIPVAYDGRKLDRTPQVRDQGALGTCWAFAAAGALEASLLPEEKTEFSVDHMSLNNAFGRSQEIGGEYTMAISYLLSWSGPVWESEDPYGDGKTDKSLPARRHVQEIQIIPQKDLNRIKEAVYLYGGVQTSLYSSFTDREERSEYYNPETASYFYVGTEKMNHDVLIVGWDDNYPKENFNTLPEGNGAFLCMNSWGKDFGENGFFWVSYFDSGIGIYNIVYTGIEEPDNYDMIYQSDLCGWVGQLGYGKEDAYFCNIYTAGQDESMEAVGFYAVGKDTEYEIYLVHNFEKKEDLTFSDKLASGSFLNPGYYTVRLDSPQPLSQGERYGVIVYVRTPGEQRPIAVEYSSEKDGVEVDLSDGEGYISLRGSIWQSAEETQNCNVCLKVYTNRRYGGAPKSSRKGVEEK